jgi:tyrosine-protein kinase Etk/Wzc
LVAFRSFREVEAIQTLAQSLIEAETERTELRARWTEGHPEVVALDRQIDQLEARLEDIGQDYLRSLDDQIASLDSTLLGFGRDLERIPSRELQYARLERQAVLLADLYSVLRQRLKEAEVRAAVEDLGVVVVEPAILPWEPIHPRPIRYMALAGILGLMLGLVLAFVRERLDTVFRREDDVGEWLGLSVLSQVPRLSPPSGKTAGAGALVAVGRGPSLPAEAFRTLRTSVFFATQDSGGAREILVTSPGSREGKSTTCCNVAITSAQQGLNTLLVDCDLRRGGLHRVFDVRNPPGLSDFLDGQLSPDKLVHPTNVSNLYLVPAGSPVQNPSELLGGPEFDRFLDSSRKSFEVIIVDSPPVLAVTDAIVLSTKIGGVILVVRTDRTHRQAAADALTQLQTVGAGMLGVVVNDTPGKGRYGYRNSYYYDYLAERLKPEDLVGGKL